jgi:saccharopine dehydrogenase-like NADP-dependent oxidoreductase
LIRGRKEVEEDFMVMQVIVEGQKGESRLRYMFDLYDEYDHETGTTFMARTTGYTCTIAASQEITGCSLRRESVRRNSSEEPKDVMKT